MKNDDSSRYKTVGEVLDELGEEVRRLQSDDPVRDGRWVYDKREFVVRHTETGYEVPLDEVHNSASALDWILQLAEKHAEVVSNEDLGRFVRLVNRIFSLHSVCGSGNDRDFAPRVVARRPAS